MFALPVNLVGPMSVLRQALQKVVEVVIVDTDPACIEIGRIDIHQISASRRFQRVQIQRSIGSCVIKYGLVYLSDEGSEVNIERSVPCTLIAEAPFHVRHSHIEIRAMEQIIGALDNTCLKKSKEGHGSFGGILHDPIDVEYCSIQPQILVIREVDVAKVLLDERGVIKFRVRHCYGINILSR